MLDTTLPSDEDESYVSRQQSALALLLEVSQAEKAAPRRHRKLPHRYAVLARRLVLFNGIGLAVFVFGALLQWPLVRPLGSGWSHAVQAVVSVEASWALNRWLTWRGRNTGARSLLKWNAQCAVSAALNYGVCFWLIHAFGTSWLDASVVSTAVLVPVNYWVGDRWSFAPVKEKVAARPRWRLRPTQRWLLLGVLVLQAGLSVRLVWANTAFGDEALYLWAGHLEWAHWLHGTTSPYFQLFPDWFSGAPVIYPPLGALADSFGGLAAARALSGIFMLGTTTFLHGVARRVYDRRVAFLAAALFATLAGTQFLGAFATYDAPALFLLAFAVWLGVRATRCESWGSVAALLLTSGVILTVANATKYATTLFSPVVLVVIALMTCRCRGMRAGVTAGAIVLGAWGLSLLAALRLGGRAYWTGVMVTTLARQQSNSPTSVIIQRSYTWIGLILILALSAALLSIPSKDRSGKILLAVLAAAALLVPIDQARIHTTVSLQKHVVFGAWFAAIAAGYALAKLSRVDRGHGWMAVLTIPIIANTLFGSVGQANALYSVWPNSTRMIAALTPIVSPSGGPYLFEEFDVAYYYLHRRVYPGEIENMFGFVYWDDATHSLLRGNAAFRQAIADRHFTIIEVDGQNISAATTAVIEGALARTPGYQLIDRYWSNHHWVEIWRLRSHRRNP